MATGPLTKPKVVEPKSSLSFQPKRKPNILRTIYMPNYEVDQGTDQINKMRDLIAEEKEYYEGLMKDMQEEKVGFEEGLRDRYIGHDEQYNEALNTLHEKERYN